MRDYNISILDRDEDGATWRLSVPSVQGAFDLVIEGFFKHHSKARRASYWELFNFHKSNGMDATAEQIESLLGHGCRDRANEILETILGPEMEKDFDLWEEFLESGNEAARHEEKLNNDFFRRSAGF